METENELNNITELIRDICLGDDEGFNTAGLRSDAARMRFFDKVMKALGEMMGSYSSQDQDDKLEHEVKRLEQALGITISAASISGVTFKKEEDGEASDQRGKSEEGFKKERVGGTGKKSSMGCIKESKESDKEFGVPNVKKVQANEVGIMLSRLIVDFMFLMSGKEQWAEKLESFKSELKGVSMKNVNSMVINKIVTTGKGQN